MPLPCPTSGGGRLVVFAITGFAYATFGQRPLVTPAVLANPLPNIRIDGRPVANAEALAVKLAPFRTNLATGEWRRIEDARITAPVMRFVTDRQGRFRMVENRTVLPFDWRVRSGGVRLERRRNLEDAIDPTLAATFEAGPEALWSDRSLLLEFGADPAVLYYASNANRNTFGIYAVNLETGERTNFVVANDRLDLADPEQEISPRAIGRTERFLRAENAAVYYTDFRPSPPASPLILDRATHNPVGEHTHDYASGAHWLDDEIATVQTEINA